MKSVFNVLVKKNGTEEFDLIKIFNKFGADICQALLFLYAFSGCNTVYSFYDKGKSILWDAWMSFSKSTEYTYTFIELGNSPLTVFKENIKLVELFVRYMYFGNNHRYTDINEARCTSFFKSLNPKLKDTVYQKMLYWSTKNSQPIKWAGYVENVSIMLLSQFLNYGTGNLTLDCAQSTFLDGNKKILKQPFKMLCQHVDVRRAIA